MESVTKIVSNPLYWHDEITCYKRLEKSKYVPRLISYDESSRSITTEYRGETLFTLTINNKPIEIDTPIKQFLEFVSDCQQKNIVHLDLHPNNILLLNKRLYFIDFEKVVIDNKTSTAKCNKKYQKLLGRGGWDRLINNYKVYFKTYNNRIFYNEKILEKGIRNGKTL